jgi:hypothetical protein
MGFPWSKNKNFENVSVDEVRGSKNRFCVVIVVFCAFPFKTQSIHFCFEIVKDFFYSSPCI